MTMASTLQGQECQWRSKVYYKSFVNRNAKKLPRRRPESRVRNLAGGGGDDSALAALALRVSVAALRRANPLRECGRHYHLAK
jgi:hypothetical protein